MERKIRLKMNGTVRARKHRGILWIGNVECGGEGQVGKLTELLGARRFLGDISLMNLSSVLEVFKMFLIVQ